MWFFKPKPIISEEQLHWQIASYQWLLRNYGGRFRNGTYVLVKPTKQYFPDSCDSTEALFRNTFDRVKKYVGMEAWPCDLAPQEEDPDAVVGDTLIVQNTDRGPAGTFRYQSDQKALVTYKPSLASSPEAIVSTFAHELGHYLTAHCDEPPPGGWELWEHATDLTAVYMGFGIFMANSAFVFKQYSSAGTQGWSTQSLGYLSQTELVNALVIFLVLKDIDVKEAQKHINPGIRANLRKAFKYLKNSEVLNPLKFLLDDPEKIVNLAIKRAQKGS